MEPRPNGRGNGRPIALLTIAPNASMEPRPNGRGNATPTEGWAAADRRFNGAPTKRSGKPACTDSAFDGMSELQWSPDQTVGETCASSVRWTGVTGFNGAPTKRSGKPPLALGANDGFELLQWSPDQTVGETRRNIEA